MLYQATYMKPYFTCYESNMHQENPPAQLKYFFVAAKMLTSFEIARYNIDCSVIYFVPSRLPDISGSKVESKTGYTMKELLFLLYNFHLPAKSTGCFPRVSKAAFTITLSMMV